MNHILDELQRKAEAAPVGSGWYVLTLANGSDVRARHITGASTWIAQCRTNEDAAYIACASPDVMLRLIAVARAAQKIDALKPHDRNRLNSTAGKWVTLNVPGETWLGLQSSLAALEAGGTREEGTR